MDKKQDLKSLVIVDKKVKIPLQKMRNIK